MTAVRVPGKLRDNAESAREVLREMMDARSLAKLDAAARSGAGRWVPDPSVPRVWGFEVAGEVVCVVYLDELDGEGDFESGPWFDE